MLRPLGDLKVGDKFWLSNRCGCVYIVTDEEPDTHGFRHYERFTPCKTHKDEGLDETISGHITADVDVID